MVIMIMQKLSGFLNSGPTTSVKFSETGKCKLTSKLVLVTLLGGTNDQLSNSATLKACHFGDCGGALRVLK